MYIETSTTELSISEGGTDTAELRFTQPFGALRVTFESTLGEGATGFAPQLSDIDRLLVELPGRGGLSRRINLSGAEVLQAGLVASLGAETGDDAAAASSYPMFASDADAASITLDRSFIDLPVGAKAGEEIRITVSLAAATLNDKGVTVRFSALTNVTDRNLIFEVTSLGTGTRVDHTFRTDAEPLAIVVGSGAVDYAYDLLSQDQYADLTEINFDGAPRFTYDDISVLRYELDRVITSTQGNGYDASDKDLAFAVVPDGVKKINIEANTAGVNRWVVVSYIAGVGA